MRPESFMNILKIIHVALCAGLAIFAFIAYYQIGDFTAQMNQRNIFIYLVPVLAAAGYFLSQFFFKKQVEAISKEESLSVKLGKYQTASIFKYALLEGPGIVALMAYYWSGNALHLVIAIALIVYLFAQRPTADKIKKELPLTYEEQKQFLDL